MFCPSQNLSMAEISCRLTNFYYENYLFEIYIIGRFFEILWLKMLLLSEYKWNQKSTIHPKKFFNYMSTFPSNFEH